MAATEQNETEQTEPENEPEPEQELEETETQNENENENENENGNGDEAQENPKQVRINIKILFLNLYCKSIKIRTNNVLFAHALAPINYVCFYYLKRNSSYAMYTAPVATHFQESCVKLCFFLNFNFM